LIDGMAERFGLIGGMAGIPFREKKQ